MPYGRRTSSRRRTSRTYATRGRRSAGRRTYGVRRQPRRRVRSVSRRSASSARPQRVVIEVRQAPVAQNPIEGLLAAAKQVEKPKKAKF